jgi:hypothetical protein
MHTTPASRENTSPALVALGVAAVSALVACLINRPWEGVHLHDGAYYAYLAELQGRGFAPYRDVFLLQGPILVWLGGLSVWLGGPIGLALLGASIAGLMTFGAVLLALEARGRGGSFVELLPAALVAWGVTTGWPFIGAFIVSGSRPKFLAVGLAALGVHLLCANRRVASGAAFAAACWAWQPGAVIAVGAVTGWVVARIAERGGDASRSVATMLAGVALGVGSVSAAAVALLAAQGSLEPFVEQAILSGPAHTGRTFDPGAPFHRIAMLLPLPVLIVGGAGLAGVIGASLSRSGGVLTPRARRVRAALLGWLVAYLALLFVDLDARGDTVPLLLPLGVFAGMAMSQLGNRVALSGQLAVAGLLCFWLAGGDMLSPLQHSPFPYRDGRSISRQAAEDTLRAAAGRGVLIFADPLLAQRVGEDPKHPYVYWEPGTVEHIRSTHAGGVDGFLDRLVEQRYGVVTVGPRAAALLPYVGPRLEGLYARSEPIRRRNHTWVLREPSQP